MAKRDAADVWQRLLGPPTNRFRLSSPTRGIDRSLAELVHLTRARRHPSIMRFPMDADDRATASEYLIERAHQAAIDGWRPVAFEPEPLVDGALEWGVRGRARKGDRQAQSIYVYASARGAGKLPRYLRGSALPVITTPDCEIEDFLRHVGVEFEVVAAITDTREYKAIEASYGSRRAERSQVLLMHHVDEGLQVLAQRGASTRAMKAFCLHPLVQEDVVLAASYARLHELTDDPAVLALALEYRNIANATLSTCPIASASDIPLSPLAEVNEMLVADKLQNWKDFVLQHRATHPRNDALERYFALWHERLGITSADREHWFEALQITPAPISLRAVIPKPQTNNSE
jgi:hypothetical protein